MQSIVKTTAAALAGAVLLAACAAPSTTAADGAQPANGRSIPVRPVSDAGFYEWITNDLGNRVRADSRYRRLPLDTTVQQNDFLDLAHALYQRKITPDQFKRQLLAQYPGHEYEVNFIAASLPPARPAQVR